MENTEGFTFEEVLEWDEQEFTDAIKPVQTGVAKVLSNFSLNIPVVSLIATNIMDFGIFIVNAIKTPNMKLVTASIMLKITQLVSIVFIACGSDAVDDFLAYIKDYVERPRIEKQAAWDPILKLVNRVLGGILGFITSKIFGSETRGVLAGISMMKDFESLTGDLAKDLFNLGVEADKQFSAAVEDYVEKLTQFLETPNHQFSDLHTTFTQIKDVIIDCQIFLRNIPEDKKKVVYPLTQLVGLAVKRKNDLMQNVIPGLSRQEPFVVLLQGEGAIGKTTFVRELIRQCLTFIPGTVSYAKDVIEIRSDDKYWPPMSGQRIWFMDEVASAAKLTEDKLFTGIKGICSQAFYNCPGADIEHKISPCTAEIIFATTNTPFSDISERIYNMSCDESVAPVWRRIMAIDCLWNTACGHLDPNNPKGHRADFSHINMAVMQYDRDLRQMVHAGNLDVNMLVQKIKERYLRLQQEHQDTIRKNEEAERKLVARLAEKQADVTMHFSVHLHGNPGQGKTPMINEAIDKLKVALRLPVYNITSINDFFTGRSWKRGIYVFDDIFSTETPAAVYELFMTVYNKIIPTNSFLIFASNIPIEFSWIPTVNGISLEHFRKHHIPVQGAVRRMGFVGKFTDHATPDYNIERIVVNGQTLAVEPVSRQITTTLGYWENAKFKVKKLTYVYILSIIVALFYPLLLAPMIAYFCYKFYPRYHLVADEVSFIDLAYNKYRAFIKMRNDFTYQKVEQLPDEEYIFRIKIPDYDRFDYNGSISQLVDKVYSNKTAFEEDPTWAMYVRLEEANQLRRSADRFMISKIALSRDVVISEMQRCARAFMEFGVVPKLRFDIDKIGSFALIGNDLFELVSDLEVQELVYIDESDNTIVYIGDAEVRIPIEHIIKDSDISQKFNLSLRESLVISRFSKSADFTTHPLVIKLITQANRDELRNYCMYRYKQVEDKVSDYLRSPLGTATHILFTLALSFISVYSSYKLVRWILGLFYSKLERTDPKYWGDDCIYVNDDCDYFIYKGEYGPITISYQGKVTGETPAERQNHIMQKKYDYDGDTESDDESATRQKQRKLTKPRHVDSDGDTKKKQRKLIKPKRVDSDGETKQRKRLTKPRRVDSDGETKQKKLVKPRKVDSDGEVKQKKISKPRHVDSDGERQDIPVLYNSAEIRVPEPLQPRIVEDISEIACSRQMTKTLPHINGVEPIMTRITSSYPAMQNALSYLYIMSDQGIEYSFNGKPPVSPTVYCLAVRGNLVITVGHIMKCMRGNLGYHAYIGNDRFPGKLYRLKKITQNDARDLSWWEVESAKFPSFKDTSSKFLTRDHFKHNQRLNIVLSRPGPERELLALGGAYVSMNPDWIAGDKNQEFASADFGLNQSVITHAGDCGLPYYSFEANDPYLDKVLGIHFAGNVAGTRSVGIFALLYREDITGIHTKQEAEPCPHCKSVTYITLASKPKCEHHQIIWNTFHDNQRDSFETEIEYLDQMQPGFTGVVIKNAGELFYGSVEHSHLQVLPSETLELEETRGWQLGLADPFIADDSRIPKGTTVSYICLELPWKAFKRCMRKLNLDNYRLHANIYVRSDKKVAKVFIMTPSTSAQSKIYNKQNQPTSPILFGKEEVYVCDEIKDFVAPIIHRLAIGKLPDVPFHTVENCETVEVIGVASRNLSPNPAPMYEQTPFYHECQIEPYKVPTRMDSVNAPPDLMAKLKCDSNGVPSGRVTNSLKWAHPMFPLDRTVKRRATQELTHRFIQLYSGLQPLTDKQVLEGYPKHHPLSRGLQGLELDSSVGLTVKQLFPGVFKKSEIISLNEKGEYAWGTTPAALFVKEEFERCKDLAAKGEKYFVIFNEMCKMEKIKPSKEFLPRTFVAEDIVGVLMERRIMGEYNARAMLENDEIGVGMNPYVDFNKLHRKLYAKPNIIACDFSNWDKFIPTWAFDIFFDLLEKVNPKMSNEISALRKSLVSRIQVSGSTMFVVRGGMPSGSVITATANSDLAYIMYFVTYLILAERNNKLDIGNLYYFSKYVVIKQYGDDGNIGVDDEIAEWFNAITISGVMKEFGVTMTPAENKDGEILPFDEPEHVSFISRFFRKLDSHQFITGALKKISINTHFVWCKSRDPAQLACQLEIAQYEAALWEQEYFDEIQQNIRKAIKICPDISRHFGFRTREDIQEEIFLQGTMATLEKQNGLTKSQPPVSKDEKRNNCNLRQYQTDGRLQFLAQYTKSRRYREFLRSRDTSARRFNLFGLNHDSVLHKIIKLVKEGILTNLDYTNNSISFTLCGRFVQHVHCKDCPKTNKLAESVYLHAWKEIIEHDCGKCEKQVKQDPEEPCVRPGLFELPSRVSDNWRHRDETNGRHISRAGFSASHWNRYNNRSLS